ncbi:MAG: GPW/gp25 family protein [Clostridiales bacterium]|nr:GPW/gp25 family protein [Clostridiales bacterium]
MALDKMGAQGSGDTHGSDRNIGLAFPFQIDEDGRLMACTYEEHVKQSIRTLLMTSRDQRVMRRDFGNRLGDYLFDNIGVTTAALIEKEIVYTIGRYEPRVEIISVKASGTQAPGTMLVEVAYRILSTGQDDRLALTIGR